MQNNFKQFIEYISPDMGSMYSSQSIFYNVAIIKRKKDHMGVKGNNNSRTIKQYMISDYQELEKYKDEIISLCEMFGARAQIDPQIRFWDDYAKELNVILAQRMITNETEHLERAAFKAAATCKRATPYWILDIDDPNQLDPIKKYLEDKFDPVTWEDGLKFGDKYIIQPGETTPGSPRTHIILQVKTNSGYHLVVEKFDSREFQEKWPDVEIKKNNMTILYSPKSIDK